MSVSSGLAQRADRARACPLFSAAETSSPFSRMYRVHVDSQEGHLPGGDLLALLERQLPVKFDTSRQSDSPIAGRLMVGRIAAGAPEGTASVSTLIVPREEEPLKEGNSAVVSVHFTDDSNTPFPFRGRSLRTKVAVEPKPLVLAAHERVLATSDAGPVWTLFSGNGFKRFRSAFPAPTVSAQGKLHDVLNGDRFLELVPVLQWLRELCDESLFEPPPLRACFMFDDPNLHWPRYGYVDYRQIAAHAERENYHVSFATIPLDTWFIHRPTAELFRHKADRLSLVVHGNDHTWKELAQDHSRSTRLGLLRQSVQRIKRFERKTNLQVCRVMVPPGGASSAATLELLPSCGFEAACISHGSLGFYTERRPWTRHLGYAVSELLEGCAVLPRWALGDDIANTILLAAFLRQALILRAHHDDLRRGIDWLDQHARFINRLGSVRWCKMSDVCRSNYDWRLAGDTLWVMPRSPVLALHLPERARQLAIRNPAGVAWTSWQVSGPENFSGTVRSGEPIALPGVWSPTLRVENIFSGVEEVGLQRAPRLGPFGRRLLTESRDRFMPWVLG